MEQEKQIKEMAQDLNETTFGVNTQTLADHLKPETINKIAKHLTAKGYRKESEVVAEVLAKVKECVKEYMLDKGLYLATVKHALNYAERIIKGE